MLMPQFPILISERLRLRRISYADRKEIYFLRSDDVVNQFIARTQAENIGDADRWIERINNHIDEGKIFNWAITLTGNKELIGTICLWNFSADRKTAEVGYDLKPDFYQKGIMSEALKTVIHYAKEVLFLKRISAYTHVQNNASINLLKRNGFNLQTEIRDPDFEHNRIYFLDI
ncbi:MAG: GNAT family N-acetyltransferase [Bacteroidetes bacterium]|nr:GNAT family N-acetyltransferase [Bacteroidota bacterium]